MKTIFRLILVIVGAFLTGEALFLFAVANFNLGYMLALLLGAAMLCDGLFCEKINEFCKNGFRLWAKRIISAGVIAVLIFCAALQSYGAIDNAKNTEDAVIVLGAAVHGRTVSLPLKYRLDKAAEYLNKNKGAVVVVSGGQGNQEDISEAAAMEAYLIKEGIDKNRIVKEEKSTSTYENFEFSKKILDEKLGADYKTVFVTNEFHVFRAERIAKNAGFEEISHIGAKIDWYTVPANCLRECAAVLKFFITGK